MVGAVKPRLAGGAGSGVDNFFEWVYNEYIKGTAAFQRAAQFLVSENVRRLGNKAPRVLFIPVL